MLLVILGAGASYDSVDRTSWSHGMVRGTQESGAENFQPPLANDVFDNRPNFREVLLRFPECAALAALLRKRRPAADFLLERELRQRQDEAEQTEFQPYHEELVAVRFYLQHTLWECGVKWHSEAGGATNYADLLSRLALWNHRTSENVCIVTFNYDTMLEAAAEPQLRTRLRTLDSYVSGSAFAFIKLHGSVNWTRPVLLPGVHGSGDRSRRALIKLAPHYELGEFEVRDPDTKPSVMAGGNTSVHLPALAIPVERKAQFECPNLHLKTLNRAVRAADRVLVIGWNATEFDFISRLRALRSEVRWLIVNGGHRAGAEALDRVHRLQVPVAASSVFHGGFSQLLVSGELEAFLATP